MPDSSEQRWAWPRYPDVKPHEEFVDPESFAAAGRAMEEAGFPMAEVDPAEIAEDVDAVLRHSARVAAQEEAGIVEVLPPAREVVMSRRLRVCVARWPECETGAYDQRCCRFPKSCSADVYDVDKVTEADLEPPGRWPSRGTAGEGE